MKNANDNFFAVLICAFLLNAAYVPVCAADGVMWGEKDIRIVQTTWFDIIYSADAAESAAHLAEHADAIYDDVCAWLEIEQWKRFPVVITPAQDEFNAYYSPAAYDHIVMYDTPVINKIAVASDDFLMTFRHELTHAVTYNIKNEGVKKLGRIFGDVINPAFLFITRSRTEGVAVSSESAHGEGRLNDSYSLQMVRQAKLENSFPSHADIYGSRDIYPYDTNYYFGASFESWLQKTFGMKKYAQFWYKCVNLQTIHPTIAFKAVYGMSEKDAWRKFKESIDVPAVSANPLESDSYGDYFLYRRSLRNKLRKKTDAALTPGALTNSSASFSNENTHGARYSQLSSSDAGFSYVDEAACSLYVSAWSSNGTYARSKKLFTVPNQTRIALSRDGKYAAVSVMSERHAVPKSEVRVYSVQSHSWHTLKETGLRDAAIITVGRTHYVAAIKTKSQNCALVVYKLLENSRGTRVNAAVLVAQKLFPRGDVAFTPSDAADGEIVYTNKSARGWSIQLYSLVDGSTAAYGVPVERMVIRTASLADNGAGKTLVFSWAAPDAMPRFGKLLINKNHNADGSVLWCLQTDDVSGGVYNPVLLKTGVLAYAGNFFRDAKLLVADSEKILMETFAVRAEDVQTEHAQSSAMAGAQAENTDSALSEMPPLTMPSVSLEALASSKKYNPFKYYSRGIFLPAGSARTYTYGYTQNASLFSDALSGIIPSASGDFNPRVLPFGVTYASTNPWSSAIVQLSGGYSLYSNSGAIETTFSSGTATSLFSYTITDQVEFDRHGFKQTFHAVALSSMVPVGKFSKFTFSNVTNIFAGRQDLLSHPDSWRVFGALENDNLTNRFRAIAKFSVGYTTMHRTGAGTYEYGGISFATSYTAHYASAFGSALSWRNFTQDLSATLTARSPRLLPYACKHDFTYNFPFVISASIFPNDTVFWRHDAQVILFAGEVQKALPLIYVNRYAVRASYGGAFIHTATSRDVSSWNFLNAPTFFAMMFSGAMRYYDSVALHASLTLTPNFGFAATPLLRFSIVTGVRYHLHKRAYEKPFSFEFSFSASY